MHKFKLIHTLVNKKFHQLFILNRVIFSVVLICLFKPIVSQTKQVFAHYMVAINTNSQSGVAGYKQEILEAQNAGIDGFALNCGGWDTYYKSNCITIFQAAQQLGTGFKLFFSADMCCGLKSSNILDMMTTFSSHPNYFSYNNKPFLSTFGGEFKGATWWKDTILTPLQNTGINSFFVPYFYTVNSSQQYQETPSYNDVLSNYTASWNTVIDGHFYFGVAGLPFYNSPSLLTSSEAIAKVMHDNGRKFMAAVTPQYWGDLQLSNGRRYYEYQGGEGLASQWQSVITVQQPDWVQLVTWNDIAEASYFSPLNANGNFSYPYYGHPQTNFYNYHGGALEMNKYYIQWYKTNVKPVITNDKLFYSYRTHKQSEVCNDSKGSVSSLFGNIQDVIYISTMLTAPAELKVISGAVTTTYAVNSDINHIQVPFNSGSQTFELWRGNTQLIKNIGVTIDSVITEYNFHYHTGFGVDTISTLKIIENATSKLSDFILFPNPARESITVKSDNSSRKIKYSIVNLIGSAMFSGEITSENEEIKIESLPKGTYFIKLESKKTEVIKFIKT